MYKSMLAISAFGLSVVFGLAEALGAEFQAQVHQLTLVEAQQAGFQFEFKELGEYCGPLDRLDLAVPELWNGHEVVYAEVLRDLDSDLVHWDVFPLHSTEAGIEGYLCLAWFPEEVRIHFGHRARQIDLEEVRLKLRRELIEGSSSQ